MIYQSDLNQWKYITTYIYLNNTRTICQVQLFIRYHYSVSCIYNKIRLRPFIIFSVFSKICRGKSQYTTHLTDLPSVVVRYIFRCFSDHKDFASLACVNRQFHKVSTNPGLWKQLCLYHLSPAKVSWMNNWLIDWLIDWLIEFKERWCSINGTWSLRLDMFNSSHSACFFLVLFPNKEFFLNPF